MKSLVAIVLLAVLLVVLECAGIWAQKVDTKAGTQENPAVSQQQNGAAKKPVPTDPVSAAVERGANWLASVQGADGGWGQDGGDSSNVRNSVSLETTGNDVANTAIASLALLRAGDKYRPNVEHALDFILRRVEASPADGLSITEGKQTQVQRKLGPYIDTFVTSMLLAQVDGNFSKAINARIHNGLVKCVAKIERNQMRDGSWNIAGGWAPIFGTSLASRSLYEAGKKGVAVDREVMARADAYTVKTQKEGASASGGGVGDGRVPSRHFLGGGGGLPPQSASAQVPLYQDAQALEQLSRTPESRQKNQKEIAAINARLSDSRFVAGYGSIGGEEFFSYFNISDSLKRSGGKAWSEWYSTISQKILKLQNDDGTWAGQHCITGRCAVTSAAILNLTSNRGD